MPLSLHTPSRFPFPHSSLHSLVSFLSALLGPLPFPSPPTVNSTVHTLHTCIYDPNSEGAMSKNSLIGQVSEPILCFSLKNPHLCVMVKHSQAKHKITHHISYICNENKQSREQHCFNSKHSKNLSKGESYLIFSGKLHMIKSRLS